jgi:hypothetical protein
MSYSITTKGSTEAALSVRHSVRTLPVPTSDNTTQIEGRTYRLLRYDRPPSGPDAEETYRIAKTLDPNWKLLTHPELEEALRNDKSDQFNSKSLSSNFNGYVLSPDKERGVEIFYGSLANVQILMARYQFKFARVLIFKEKTDSET